MPQSLSQVYLHIVFSTKNREDQIRPEIEQPLYKYIAGILKNLECTAIKIGGTSNHIHILNTFARTISISKMLELVKKDSSKWIKTQGNYYRNFYWQNGYGVFSISQSKIEIVKKYIENQKKHHKARAFKDEYRAFLKEYNIKYDEKYLWD